MAHLKRGVAEALGETKVALSEIIFTGFGGHIDLGKNDKGEFTSLVARIVEREFRADRGK